MNTYTKLKNGEWGVRVEGIKPNTGDTILITKKSGEKVHEKINKIIWSNNTTYLCSIVQPYYPARQPNHHKHPRTGCSCGSREGIMQDTDCWQCRHDF